MERRLESAWLRGGALWVVDLPRGYAAAGTLNRPLISDLLHFCRIRIFDFIMGGLTVEAKEGGSAALGTEPDSTKQPHHGDQVSGPPLGRQERPAKERQRHCRSEFRREEPAAAESLDAITVGPRVACFDLGWAPVLFDFPPQVAGRRGGAADGRTAVAGPAAAANRRAVSGGEHAGRALALGARANGGGRNHGALLPRRPGGHGTAGRS